MTNELMRLVLLLLFAQVLLVVGCATSNGRLRVGQVIGSPAALELCPPQPPRTRPPVAVVRNPLAKPLWISAEQQKVIRKTLLPGDVLLTYTAGVSSNLLVPGRFKHAIVFVGPQPDGTGDIIEALSQGVVLNRLEDTLAMRINRLVALRPRLDDEQRREYVQEVLSYRGQRYDFVIDFLEPSRKVCTEVVYCALRDRNNFEFPLITRAGRPTLTCDDIVMTHLKQPQASTDFECVLLVDKNPEQPERAHLFLGPASARQLKRVMKMPLDETARSRS